MKSDEKQLSNQSTSRVVKKKDQLREISTFEFEIENIYR